MTDHLIHHQTHPRSPRHNRQRAFTLLELLMVITLLAIIIGLIAGGASAAIRWSRQQQTTAALTALDAVAETYRKETQEWPPAFPSASWGNPQQQMAYFIRATYGDNSVGDEAIGDIDKQLFALGSAFVPPGPPPSGPTPPAVPNGRVVDPYGNVINCYNPNKGVYAPATPYYVGDCVIYPATGGIRYRCTTAGAGNQPDISPGSWMPDATAGRPWFWSNGPDGNPDSLPNGRNNAITGSVSGDDVASTGSKP